MSAYERGSWEVRWAKALRDHGDRIADRPPNPHLVAEIGDLPSGRALDAWCGHGSETLWLAARGWQVTAVDFVATALARGRSTAEAMGSDVAGRVGGTLLLIGHRPVDPATGAATAAAGQVQVSVDAALAALDPRRWELLVAEERPRPTAGAGVDAMIRARRRPLD